MNEKIKLVVIIIVLAAVIVVATLVTRNFSSNIETNNNAANEQEIVNNETENIVETEGIVLEVNKDTFGYSHLFLYRLSHHF